MRLPAKLAPLLFGGILSGLMSLMVSGVATVRSLGLVEGVGNRWMSAWLLSWSIAFPVILLLAPRVRRLVESITIPATTGQPSANRGVRPGA